jgi:hypothetical protein
VNLARPFQGGLREYIERYIKWSLYIYRHNSKGSF